MDEFEQRSPTGRVRLVRSATEPDARGYFVYLDGALVRRTSSLAAGRTVFRQLASENDPPRPVAEDRAAAQELLMEQAMARFYAERSAGGREKGGRSRRK
jgi:hypothetical protein